MNFLDEFAPFVFATPGITISHKVYAGGAAPGVLLMHELTGLNEGCQRLACRLKAEGFRVYVPLFFGKAGECRSRIRGVARRGNRISRLVSATEQRRIEREVRK